LDAVLFPADPGRIAAATSLQTAGGSLQYIKRLLEQRGSLGLKSSMIISTAEQDEVSDQQVANVLSSLLDKTFNAKLVMHENDMSSTDNGGVTRTALTNFQHISIKLVWVACVSVLLRWGRTKSKSEGIHPILQILDRVLDHAGMMAGKNENATCQITLDESVRWAHLSVLTPDWSTLKLVALTLLGTSLVALRRSVGFGDEDEFRTAHDRLAGILLKGSHHLPEAWSALGWFCQMLMHSKMADQDLLFPRIYEVTEW
jgi:hypothetical protein